MEKKVETHRKTIIGLVVSNKMDMTAVVQVERVTKHGLYNKVVKRYVKYHAHDPKNEAQVGDKVLLEETRPLSRTKRWRIRETLTKAVEI